MKLKGARRGDAGGNFVDMVTGESFWISGVKRNGRDRHSAVSGAILIEADAVGEYLAWIASSALDTSRLQITTTIVPTDVQRISQMANARSRDSELDTLPTS